MGAADSEINSHGEVNSPLRSNQPNCQQILHSLGRQSSIYSLTLDEFQNALCENGKNFGSMNMDEFINSIWIAEGNQAQGTTSTATSTTTTTTTNIPVRFPLRENNASINQIIAQQPSSLPRQGSLSIPEPLCRKTVDEVWSEIHNNNQHNDDDHGPIHNTGTTQKQPTFGEMTLEDFLVRAGIVRERNYTHLPPQQLQFGMYQNNIHPSIGHNFAARPVMAIGCGGVNNVTTHHGLQSGVKRGGGYAQPPSAVNYGGRLGNGNGGGFGGLGMGSPVSPDSSDGMGPNQVDSGNQYGFEMDVMRGRKRIVDGPVEKVVERRQRRMIKNRESAARSRARKQAYTVELEAELNQLKEENEHLKQALAELERERKQKYYEEKEARGKTNMQPKSHKTNGKLQTTGRSFSCSY